MEPERMRDMRGERRTIACVAMARRFELHAVLSQVESCDRRAGVKALTLALGLCEGCHSLGMTLLSEETRLGDAYYVSTQSSCLCLSPLPNRIRLPQSNKRRSPLCFALSLVSVPFLAITAQPCCYVEAPLISFWVA